MHFETCKAEAGPYAVRHILCMFSKTFLSSKLKIYKVCSTENGGVYIVQPTRFLHKRAMKRDYPLRAYGGN